MTLFKTSFIVWVLCCERQGLFFSKFVKFYVAFLTQEYTEDNWLVYLFTLYSLYFVFISVVVSFFSFFLRKKSGKGN